MSEWGRFQSQFYETEWDRRERFRRMREQRTAEGKCWQCGAQVADCSCPNIKHAVEASNAKV